MTRILPRLAKEIEKHSGLSNHATPLTKRPKKSPKSLWRPPLLAPSFHPSHFDRSILLAPHNPVENAGAYELHKRLPPSVSDPGPSDEGVVDPPRQMTGSEFGWWANPYLRMLSSPLRTCIATNKTLPNDFLIRLAGMRIPSSDTDQQTPTATLAPDGVLHPKHVSRIAGGHSVSVLCWRKAVELLREKGVYRRISGQIDFSPSLPDYIAHLLRLRVLQELELLTERIEWAVHHGTYPNNGAVILRRLPRHQWDEVNKTGTIPFPSAVAILVVPPLNMDRFTHDRPRPSMSGRPPTDEDIRTDGPPLSVLLPQSKKSSPADESGILPIPTIPIYHGVTAFPSRSQRAALYDFLTRILKAERTWKKLDVKKSNQLRPLEPRVKLSSSKGSHAFLLYSDAGTARRGDVAAVAKALWRLRMYEGDGWIPS